MYWAAIKPDRAALLCTLFILASAPAGCGRPQGVLFEMDGPARVWPAPPETPRIRFVGALANSNDLKAPQSGMEAFRSAIRGPRPPIRFASPHGIAMRWPATLAVADGTGAAFHVIDLERRTHRRVTGWADNRFDTPLGIAWVGNRLFVTDAQRHEVMEFDSEGVFQTRFGTKQLKRPVGVAYVAQREQLYVVDGGDHCLKVFDLEGTMIETIGRRGTGPGEFNFPSHICSAGDRILVADTGNFRAQLLDLDGVCLTTIGQKGNAAGDLALPKGVALDDEGHIYVVDAHFENVQVFDAEGRLLLTFGAEGRGDGEFWLPAGIAIDPDNRIWVADSGNHRVQVFKYIKATS